MSYPKKICLLLGLAAAHAGLSVLALYLQSYLHVLEFIQDRVANYDIDSTLWYYLYALPYCYILTFPYYVCLGPIVSYVQLPKRLPGPLRLDSTALKKDMHLTSQDEYQLRERVYCDCGRSIRITYDNTLRGVLFSQPVLVVGLPLLTVLDKRQFQFILRLFLTRRRLGWRLRVDGLYELALRVIYSLTDASSSLYYPKLYPKGYRPFSYVLRCLLFIACAPGVAYLRTLHFILAADYEESLAMLWHSSSVRWTIAERRVWEAGFNDENIPRDLVCYMKLEMDTLNPAPLPDKYQASAYVVQFPRTCHRASIQYYKDVFGRKRMRMVNTEDLVNAERMGRLGAEQARRDR